MGTASFVNKIKNFFFYNEKINIFLLSGSWAVCDILSDEQEQMPMEESANMLLMLAAVVQK
jgi:hypothetical protein